MQVFLEAIKFNHDPTFATTGAFNLRKNETEVVNIPEWLRSVSVRPEDSEAAYSPEKLTGTPTIRAKFRFSDFHGVNTVKIRALDASISRNILGAVAERDVNVPSAEEFELFFLDGSQISTPKVTVSDIVWRWQFRTDCIPWTDFQITTHRIYTVLARPKLPWKPDSPNPLNTQQPWSEVLDYACRWADSATGWEEAATLVTRRVSGLGPELVHYDNPHSGLTSFTIDSPPSFDCTDFLLLLRRQQNQHGSAVNCDDCSAFVTSFANILGCDLAEAQMERDFALHPHQRIGLSGLQTQRFSYHAVAWSGAAGEDDELFDACVQLDSDDDPASCPHPLFVPTNIRFGRRDEQLYRFRLASNPDACIPVPGSALRRRIGFPKVMIELSKRLENITFMQEHSSEQAGISRIFNRLLAKLNSERDEFAAWKPESFYFIDDRESLLAAHLFWRQKNDVATAIRVEAHAGSSVESANAKLQQLLSRFELLDITQQKPPRFGDVLYAVPGDFAVVFARGEFVFRLRNVGKKLISCENFAHAIDNLLIGNSNKESGE